MDLLERDTCLSDLKAWLAELPRAGCVVLVGAEAGLGKTSLVRAFAEGQTVARVLWGACDALFTPRPLAPLLDIARDAGGALRAAVRAKAGRDELFATLLDEFESLPTLAVFEDLHWADEATLDLLKFLGRRIARTRTMLLVTYRDDEVGRTHPLWQVLADLPRVATRRLALLPLSEPAVAQLARSASRSVHDLYRVTGGNPLFVTEVLASEGQGVPGSIREAALARASRMAPCARRVAELASIVPGAVDAALLTAVLAPAAADIDGCLELGMVRGSDGSLAFRHELVRRAFEESLPPAQRREWHVAVLRTLESRSDVAPARLVHHAAGAEDAQAVLQHAPVAGAQAAAVGAHREAALHYALAQRHAGALAPRERAHLHELLAYEYYLTNRIGDALEQRRGALQLWTTVGERLRQIDTTRWLSRLSWFCGRRSDAERYASETLAMVEGLPIGREVALAYSNHSQLEMLANRTDSCVSWATRAIDIGERIGDAEVLSHALNNRGSARMLAGDEEGRADLERSLQIALAGDLQEHVARAYTNLASTEVSRRRYELGLRAAEAGMAYCEQRDLDAWRLYIQTWRARARFDCGDWQGAAEDAAAASSDALTVPITRLPALVVLAHVRARRGDPDVRSLLDEARTLASTVDEIQRTAPLVVAVAESAQLEDRLVEAVDELRAAYALAMVQTDHCVIGDIAIWLWRAGALEALPEGLPLPIRHEAAGDWLQAAQAWAAIGCPYERACMLAWYGDEPAQRDALAEFERLGAEPAAQQLRRHMREVGVRGIPRGLRESTRSHAFGLTRREAQVLQLMAAGLRNAAIARKLYVSTRTIDHHVSAVLAKLGVTTRAEAIAVAGASATEAPGQTATRSGRHDA